MTDVFIRKGTPDTLRDTTRDPQGQTEDHVRTQREGSHLPAKDEGLRKETHLLMP